MLRHSIALLAQNGGGGGGIGGTIGSIIYLALVIAVIAGFWKMLVKAGLPGWGCLIPIYNLYLLCKVAGKPGWWILLFLIPLVNFVIYILVCVDIAKNFGKGAGFALGLVFLGFVFYPILGFGDAQYRPVTASAY